MTYRPVRSHSAFAFVKRAITATAAVFFAAGLINSAQAVPLTGTPVGNSFGWVPNSTNELNYNMLVPGREGQTAPHVLFNSNDAGSVILDFFNFAPGGAYFEVRIDDAAPGAPNHPIVIGDSIRGGVSVASGTSVLGEVFAASNYVDVRLALGGERDWDFDWTRFEVLQGGGQVPAPGTLGLAGLALLLLAARRRS